MVTEAKVEHNHMNVESRYYEANYRYVLTCGLSFYPGITPELTNGQWIFQIYDTKNGKHPWKGTLQELIEKVLS